MVKKKLITLTLILVLIAGMLTKPYKVSGEVKPIEEAKEQLQGISEKEQKTLERLFILTQEIEEMEREEARITKEINELIIEIDSLDKAIIKEQEEYDVNLGILEQVLKSYQRGGPASYLDILLKAENLTAFIKSLNLIKDISKNTGELLASIEESKRILEEKKLSLADNMTLLENKREELKEPIAERKRLVKEQEDYLNSLSEEKELYQQHLDNVKLMWDNLKNIFSQIVDEFTRIVSEGHVTMEDLNIEFNFFSITGSIHQDTFNRLVNDYSTLPRIVCSFSKDNVRFEVPDNNLVLDGDFELVGSASLLFVPKAGTFFGMALEKESINELFKNGPLLIDLNQVAGSVVTIDIELEKIETNDGYISFSIDIGSFF